MQTNVTSHQPPSKRPLSSRASVRGDIQVESAQIVFSRTKLRTRISVLVAYMNELDLSHSQITSPSSLHALETASGKSAVRRPALRVIGFDSGLSNMMTRRGEGIAFR